MVWLRVSGIESGINGWDGMLGEMPNVDPSLHVSFHLEPRTYMSELFSGLAAGIERALESCLSWSLSLLLFQRSPPPSCTVLTWLCHSRCPLVVVRWCHRKGKQFCKSGNVPLRKFLSFDLNPRGLMESSLLSLLWNTPLAKSSSNHFTKVKEKIGMFPPPAARPLP